VQPTLIVGDVHGCAAEFAALLGEAGFGPGMRLISVGDLINKGPDSLGALELAHANDARVVMGNHERGFLKYLARGGSGHADFETVKTALGANLNAWVDWIDSWPLYLDEPELTVVHAGLQPGRHPSETDAGILTKIRTWDGEGENLDRPDDPPWYDFYRDDKLVVFGHWAQLGLMVRPNAICLDTGCVYGGALTGLLLPERRLISVEAGRAYRAVGQ